MPPLKFKSPEGKIITIDSPDGSIPTEQELDQLFAMAGNDQGQEVSPIPRPSLGQQIGQSFKNTAEGIINPPYRIAAHTLQGLEGMVRGGKATTYTNPITKDVVEPYTNKTRLTEPIGLGLQGGAMAIPGTPAVAGSMYGVGSAMEERKNLPAILGQGILGAGIGKGIGFLSGQPLLTGRTGAIIGKVGKGIKNLPNRLLRGGLSKQEAGRIANEYGTSNSALVDKTKNLLNAKGDEADFAYSQAFKNSPEGKQIDIRPSIEAAGRKLKKLGLITDSGKMTELGQSEIAKDSVYGKMLDFYQSADAISGVGKLAEKESLTQGQMIKAMRASKETLVNKEQYTFFRDKLNNLYKGKPSDVDVSDVVNQFYQDGENSGITGLQAARRLQRDYFRKRDMFLNEKSGDLKVATEQKLSKVDKLSKQELDHIRDLERYLGTKILPEAKKINTLNEATKILSKRKDQLKWAGIGAGSALVGLKGREKLMR